MNIKKKYIFFKTKKDYIDNCPKFLKFILFLCWLLKVEALFKKSFILSNFYYKFLFKFKMIDLYNYKKKTFVRFLSKYNFKNSENGDSIFDFLCDSKKIPYEKTLTISNSTSHIKYKHKNPSIVQITPSYVPRDGVCNMVKEISNYLFSKGIENYIVVDNSTSQENDFYLKTQFIFNKNDIIVYHMSAASTFPDFFIKNKMKIIIIYHNITPAKFMPNLELKRHVNRARIELKKIRSICYIACAVSKYNENELKKIKFKKTTTIPYIHKVEKLLSLKTTRTRHKYKCFITVGRFAMNKCITDIIDLFYQYNKLDKFSRLYLIGKKNDNNYYELIKNKIKKLGLSKIVFIKEDVNLQELAYFYSNANAYLCMSEHEGFCVPLIEAMAFGVPIFAYNSTAIPETLNNSGVLFATKNHVDNAKKIYNIMRNKKTINSIVDNELKRYKYFNNNINLKKYFNMFKHYGCVKCNKQISLFYKIKNIYENSANKFYPISNNEFLSRIN